MDELAEAKRTWDELSQATADLTERHENAVVAAYHKTGSYEAVAEHVGRNPEGVRQVLKRRGVKLPGRGRPRKADGRGERQSPG